MYYSIFRPVLFGVLLGLGIYFIPFFILKVLLFFVIVGALIRFFIFRRIRRFFTGQLFITGYADRIRRMSDAEYKKHKQRYQRGFYSYQYAYENSRPNGPTIDIEIK